MFEDNGKITKINGKQNEKIAVLEEIVKRFDKFIDNDFHHYKKGMKAALAGLYLLIVSSILVPLAFKYLF